MSFLCQIPASARLRPSYLMAACFGADAATNIARKARMGVLISLRSHCCDCNNNVVSSSEVITVINSEFLPHIK